MWFDWNSVKKCLLSEEYTPLCEYFSISFLEEYLPLCELTIMVFTLENVIYLKNIHLCVIVFSFLFIEEYPLLWELTKMKFSTLTDCLLHEEYTPLSERFSIFQWKIFTSVRVDKNVVFYIWKCYLLEEYTPLCVFKKKLMKNLNLCMSLLKCCFLHLFFYQKNVHLWVSVFLFFYEDYLPLCELTKMLFCTLENVI